MNNKREKKSRKMKNRCKASKAKENLPLSLSLSHKIKSQKTEHNKTIPLTT